jgi:hypothetical protein
MGGLMAQQGQIQNAWRAGFGAPPMMQPPPGAPYGPYGPYVDPNRIAAASLARVAGVSRAITVMVACIILGVFLAVGGALAAFFLR